MVAYHFFMRRAEEQVPISSFWSQQLNLRKRHGAVPGEGQVGGQEEARPENGWALKQDPHAAFMAQADGVQEAFGQCSQTQDLNFGCSHVEPGVGLCDASGPLPTWYTLLIL